VRSRRSPREIKERDLIRKRVGETADLGFHKRAGWQNHAKHADLACEELVLYIHSLLASNLNSSF